MHVPLKSGINSTCMFGSELAFRVCSVVPALQQVYNSTEGAVPPRKFPDRDLVLAHIRAKIQTLFARKLLVRMFRSWQALGCELRAWQQGFDDAFVALQRVQHRSSRLVSRGMCSFVAWKQSMLKGRQQRCAIRIISLRHSRIATIRCMHRWLVFCRHQVQQRVVLRRIMHRLRHKSRILAKKMLYGWHVKSWASVNRKAAACRIAKILEELISQQVLIAWALHARSVFQWKTMTAVKGLCAWRQCTAKAQQLASALRFVSRLWQGRLLQAAVRRMQNNVATAHARAFCLQIATERARNSCLRYAFSAWPGAITARTREGISLMVTRAQSQRILRHIRRVVFVSWRLATARFAGRHRVRHLLIRKFRFHVLGLFLHAWVQIGNSVCSDEPVTLTQMMHALIR